MSLSLHSSDHKLRDFQKTSSINIPTLAISSVIPFAFDSNCTSNMITFHLFDALLSSLASCLFGSPIFVKCDGRQEETALLYVCKLNNRCPAMNHQWILDELM